MSESESLQHRLLDDLTRNLSVTVTAVALALVALFIPLGGGFEGRFLLAMSFLTLTYVYEESWPTAYSAGYAVLWTVGGGLLTAGVFIGVYELALSLGAGELTRAVAFLVTVGLQYGGAVLYSRAQ